MLLDQFRAITVLYCFHVYPVFLGFGLGSFMLEVRVGLEGFGLWGRELKGFLLEGFALWGCEPEVIAGLEGPSLEGFSGSWRGGYSVSGSLTSTEFLIPGKRSSFSFTAVRLRPLIVMSD